MNRGHNRAQVFDDDYDHEVFLTLLRRATNRFGVQVHGYALMKNHFHVQATPPNVTAIADSIGEVAQKYTGYYNRKHERIGSVWNGRYKSVLIEDEHQWLRCLKYIDLNPVRAHVVERPQDYRWTSFRAHGLGIGGDWLVEHEVFQGLAPTAEERRAIYRAHCAEPFTAAELTLQRYPLRLEAEADAAEVLDVVVA